MNDFFRFPSTPHLAWLGKQELSRDDKLLSGKEVKELLSTTVIVEEKLDGANVGITVDNDGHITLQNRGQYISPPFFGQFSRIKDWLEVHEDSLRKVLDSNLILFGEWCAARHSIHYTALPDWFLVFDVYDLDVSRFWSASRRDHLSEQAGLITVPRIHQGKTSLDELKTIVADRQSNFSSSQQLEGIVVRRDSQVWNEARAKLVRSGFTSAIDSHWRKRKIEWNTRGFESTGQ